MVSCLWYAERAEANSGYDLLRGTETHRPTPSCNLTQVVHFMSRHQEYDHVANRREHASHVLVGMGRRQGRRVDVLDGFSVALMVFP